VLADPERDEAVGPVSVEPGFFGSGGLRWPWPALPPGFRLGLASAAVRGHISIQAAGSPAGPRWGPQSFGWRGRSWPLGQGLLSITRTSPRWFWADRSDRLAVGVQAAPSSASALAAV